VRKIIFVFLWSLFFMTLFIFGCERQVVPAIYINSVFRDDYSKVIKECLEQNDWQAECLADTDKEYGRPGFIRRGRIHPCFKAKTDAEKEVCKS